MHLRGGTVLLVTSALLIAALALPAVAASSYDLAADPAIETPERTVSYLGTDFTLDSVTQTTVDESVLISATAPDGASYFLQFRNPDNNFVESVSRTGSATYTIDSYGTGEAGTYAVALRQDGEFKAVHPVVIPGYTLSVSAPDTVDSGDALTISTDVTERSVDRHSDLDYLQVAIYNDDQIIRRTMDNVDSETYEYTLSTDELDGDSYRVSVVVRGDAEVRGQAEVLAVAEPQALTVSDTTTETQTPTETAAESSDDGDGGGGGGAGPVAPATETSTPQPTATTQAPTRTATATASPTPSSTERTQTATRTATSSNRTATPDDDTLRPNTLQTTTGGSGPGFTPIITGLSILGSLYLSRLR